MRVCRCSFRRLLPRFKFSETRFCHQLYLIYQTFYLNNDDSVDLRIDTLLQPIFFLTDRLTKYLGRAFVCFFLTIMSIAVYLFYTSIFVHLYNDLNVKHTYFTVISHVIVSHWLLLNIMFNYVQCVRLDPGSSPNFGYLKPFEFDRGSRDSLKINQAIIDKNNNNHNKSNEVTILDLTNDSTNRIRSSRKTPLDLSDTIINSNAHIQDVCRKCIFPKPPRSHHCSVCSCCILNLDHHCPWINNCVGHLNHRYFFQFCFFLTLGAFYVASFGFIEFQHYIFGRTAFSYLDLVMARGLDEAEVLPSVANSSASYTFLFLFIVPLTASVVLLGFTLWHAWLISRAETTIEFHTNASERKRLKEIQETFINPYDLGLLLNWKMFLGFNYWHEILYKNLLPSTHRPFCNGINWPIRNLTKSFERKNKSKLMHV